ncbi:MAG: spore coat protein [Desulfotomaculaceae bacterium]|nr:spore coat protein [Desulfotomaculaceae bacterium]
MLMQDQKNHEKLCVQKYQSYANQAQGPQLKQLFNSLSQKEQEHLNSINQILNGQLPNMQQNQQMGQQTQGYQQMEGYNQQVQGYQQMPGQGAANQNDATLCNDMLVTENYISGSYDNSIFQIADTNVRQILNHIQKEEQEHGEQILNYMKNNGMYNQ